MLGKEAAEPQFARHLVNHVDGFKPLLRRHPGLWIDTCASGGRRIELESMSRAVALWRSDNTCDMVDKKATTIAMAETSMVPATSGRTPN